MLSPVCILVRSPAEWLSTLLSLFLCDIFSCLDASIAVTSVASHISSCFFMFMLCLRFVSFYANRTLLLLLLLLLLMFT